MKKYYKLLFGLFILFLQLQGVFGQSIPQRQVLVYFKSGVLRNAAPNQNTVTITSSGINATLANYGLNASNVRPAFPDFNEADTVIAEIGESSRQMNLAKVFTILLPDTSFKTSLINSLTASVEVLYAEADGDAATNIIPADGQFGTQWNMRNTLLPGADIHADGAWNIFTGNPAAIIAIVDAGVDVAHNDLALKVSGGDVGYGIQLSAGVQISHGSHVAGIAAARTNNIDNNGVAGVDWQARLHPRYVIGNGAGDAGVAQGIRNAVNFSPNVWTLNHSWELVLGIDEFGNGIPGRYSVTVRNAFAQAYRADRVSCIAMGNFNQISNGRYTNSTAFPAGFNTGSIEVGATDVNDNIAGFSARGAHIDVSAPGVNINSTNFNNGYTVLSGTSMATPHVSGLASLLKGFNTNLANDDIEQIIRLTSDDRGAAGFDNAFGAGRINAERALQSLQAPNQLFHGSVTGGTVFNTGSTVNRVFLGFPGLPDAVYSVKRSEIRTAVTFPSSYCNLVGAWGRGVGTTGYREEQGRCYGEGLCDVVPGTLTTTGATLRTFVYEVWSVNGQYLGFWPKAANAVVFQYTVLGVLSPVINGDNIFCSTSNSYTLSNLPGGASVTWQTSPAGIAVPNSPNSVSTTLTKQSNGQIALQATVSTGCGGSPFTVSKNVEVGIPASPQYILNTPDVCPQWRFNTNPAASSYTWSFYRQPYSNNLQTFPNSGAVRKLNLNQGNGTYSIGVTADNACGSSNITFISLQVNCGGGHFAMSPNPASNTVNISTGTMPQINSVSTPTISPAGNEFKIFKIRIIDKLGNVKRSADYSTGVTSVQLNINGLLPDIYIVNVFDGSAWYSDKLVVK